MLAMKQTIALFAISCSVVPVPSSLSAAVPLRWTVETSRVQPAVFDAYQGETLTFEAALQSKGKPLEAPLNYSFFWQTNGMGSTYWEAPCPVPSSSLDGASTNVLFATFTPSMDVGARVYNCFIGSPSNIYRAAFQLRLRPSPGALPNALPLPTPVIDFAEVEVANAPWASAMVVNAVLATADNARINATNALAKAKAAQSSSDAAQRSADNAQANAADAKAAAEAAAGDVEKLNIGYTRLYNFSLGSTNANFTATNYPPTKAEADARCHFEAEPGMDFSKVPASLQLNEYRDGERRTVVDTRDWTVWYFKFKERQLTNEIARLRAENIALSNKVDAAKSWADRTANGVDNPMTDTVVVDRPNLWLMADYEWQKVVSGSNQCFVIRAKNVALSGGGNTNGFLEVVDAFGKPYMRINKSSETFADPVFDEIYWDQAEGAWYVVFANSTKPIKGGANVALRGNGDGKCIFFEETDPECPAIITWPDVPESHSGHWIMKAVPKPIDGVVPSAMFFGAEIKVHGSDYVEYLKEASFGAGVRFGNNVYDYVESGDQLILRRRQ